MRLQIIEPDRGPLGIRPNPPSSRFPRRWVEQTIPLGWAGGRLLTGVLSVPSPMTEREWEMLESTLAVLKPALVQRATGPDSDGG